LASLSLGEQHEDRDFNREYAPKSLDSTPAARESHCLSANKIPVILSAAIPLAKRVELRSEGPLHLADSLGTFVGILTILIALAPTCGPGPDGFLMHQEHRNSRESVILSANKIPVILSAAIPLAKRAEL
jgi:hypothetical protein